LIGHRNLFEHDIQLAGFNAHGQKGQFPFSGQLYVLSEGIEEDGCIVRIESY
jgi:hypothetical protein